MLEPIESTRTCNGTTEPRDQDHRIAEKGFNSLSHCNLVHKLISLIQVMKIPHEEAAVDKEWEKLEKLERLPAWQVTKFNSKKEGSLKTHKKGTDCYIDGILSPQELEVGAAVPKVASCSEVMVREAGSSASLRNRSGRYYQTSWMRRTSKRRSIRLHPGQNERHSNNVGTSRV